MDLLRQIKADYPQYRFVEDQNYFWSPANQQIHYRRPIAKYSLLHELGHALQGHHHYNLGIDLLKQEADAWNQAQVIAHRYQLVIADDYIIDHLDSYRHWLQQRSRCPNCQLIGLQVDAGGRHSCLNCQQQWQAPTNPLCQVKLTLIQ